MLKMIPVLAAVAALSLGGCQTFAGMTAPDGVVVACNLVSPADLAFQVVAAKYRANATIMRQEQIVVAGMASFCANPPADKAAARAAIMAAIKKVAALEAQVVAQAGVK